MHDHIRQQVIELMPEFGFDAVEPNWETRLIEDGYPIGRRFEFDEVRAYWLRAHNVVEFYDANWALLGERKIERMIAVA